MTGIKGLSLQTTPLEYFTQAEMGQVHSAALEVLAETGTIVHHPEAVDLLVGAGASLKNENHLFIPEKLVQDALDAAPPSVTIFNRHGDPAMVLEGKNVYYGTGSDCPNLLDTDTGQRKPFDSADVEKSIRLVDALPNIDFTMSNGLAADVDPFVQYQHKFAMMVRNTTKPQVIIAENGQCIDDITEIAACVVGGRESLRQKPIFILYDEPTSPLVHTREAVEKLLFMAENGLPINYSPGMMAGASGPITIAGAITLAIAEILAGLVIHQLKNAGAPYIFGAGMSPIDMRSLQPTYSAPEAMMAQAGVCQIGRSLYKIPTWGFAGCSASKVCDEQAINEASTYIMMAGLMGTNLVHDVGYLESGLTYSFDLLVMCDEFIGQMRRNMEGIKVDRDHLAVEAIKRVGPGGDFLSDEHTVSFFRQNWFPGITDRNAFDTWEQAGASTMGQRVKEKIGTLLNNHQPEALPLEIDQKIDEILSNINNSRSAP